jgi:hypothetical protein
MTSKSQLIRDAVAQHKSLPLSKLMEVSSLQNRKKTLDLCVYMRGKGEVTIDRSGEEPIIGQGSGKPTKSPRAGSKKKHSKALRDLAINNLIASAKALADTLRREVEGVENNPNLMAAIETQERAAEIARVA